MAEFYIGNCILDFTAIVLQIVGVLAANRLWNYSQKHEIVG